MARLIGKLRRRGTLLVEAAIVLPTVVLITFTLIEGAWLMLKAEQIENAARQAARVAALNGSTNAQVDSMITQIMTSAGLTTYTKTYTPADFSKVTHGNTVQVKVTVAYKNISLTKVPLLFTSGDTTQVGSSVTMSKE